MAKSRKRDFAVSLFPFLSILACVLGVLTLMITSVVLTQIDDESVDQAKEEVLNQKQAEALKIEEKIQLGDVPMIVKFQVCFLGCFLFV